MTVVGATQTINMDLDANSAIGLSVMGVDSSNFNAFTIGSANSQNNCGVIRFKYNGAGSTNNYMGLGFYSNDDILNVKANGRVGIGTITPTAPLDVFGVRAGRNWSINNRATIRLDANGTGYPSDILFGHTAAANQTSWTGAYWSLSSRGSSDGNKFHFYRAYKKYYE